MTAEMDTVRAYYEQVGDTYDSSYEWDGPLYPSNRIRADLAIQAIQGTPGIRRVLDAGCGTGIVMKELADLGYATYGFDFSSAAVKVAKARMGPSEAWRVEVGDMEAPDPYPTTVDAALVIGAFTHPVDTQRALAHLHRAIRPGGLLIVELRNELFDALSFNDWTVRALERWLPDTALRKIALLELRERLDTRHAIPAESPAQVAHEAFFSVPAVWRNPLTVDAEYAAAGFLPVEKLGFHWHCVPPIFESLDPKAFREESLKLEANPHDWRWHFMASAFLLVCERG